MKKKFYKNNVGCIIFMVTVYRIYVRESCLSYEKTLNKCRKIYECVRLWEQDMEEWTLYRNGKTRKGFT